MTWIAEKADETVVSLKIEAQRQKDWEQWVLLTSDVHYDNPLCNRQLYKRHLDLAKERNAPVLDFGDFFCAMQGRKDPRHEKGHTRPEDNNTDYFGSLIRGSYEFLSPYADILALRGVGNHENSITKHSEIDLTRALADKLNDNGGNAIVGGYRGWVMFRLSGGNQRQTIRMYYTHGSGGSAPVTKGVIRTNRRAAFVDADIIVGGHIHESWALEMCRVGVSEAGKEVVNDQLHLCVPTYKEEFTNLGNGFHHEKEGAPKPLGGWWLRFFWDRSKEKFGYEYMRAK